MAGLYPDAPDHRMALDQDGTQMFLINGSNGVTALSAGQLASTQDETDAGVGVTPSNLYAVYIFPELRDITNYYWYMNANGGDTIHVRMDYSTDTTNGLNGTWTVAVADFTNQGLVNVSNSPGNRTTIKPLSMLGIKAIRIYMTQSWGDVLSLMSFHLYGNITAGQNPDRLALWHPTSDMRVGPAYFDWGDALRGSTADRTFRVKNLSATLSANTITCSVDALTDTTPSVVGQHTVSADGTTFAATASAGTLIPGAISGIMTIRRTTSATAVLSLWAIRVHAVAASWS